MIFEITAEDNAKISKWLRDEVYPSIVSEQLKNPDIAQHLYPDDDGIIRRPYTGAIGGGLTYEFTPTDMGVVTKVRYFNGKELDLTDYDSW